MTKPKTLTLEQVIEESRCKGCMGYPETPLKEICEKIRQFYGERLKKLKFKNTNKDGSPEDWYNNALKDAEKCL